MDKFKNNADDISDKASKPVVVHISDGHCAFDDRIFYKELCSLAKEYNCYELTATGDMKLRTMGGEKLEPGEYEGVHCLSFKGKSRNFIIRCIRHLSPDIYNYFYARKLFREICVVFEKENIHPDLIHFHDLGFTPVAERLKTHFGCKLIFDSHEFHFSYPFNAGLSKKICRRAEKALLQWKRAIKESDYTIGCTRTMDNLISIIRQDDNHGILYNSSIIKLDTRERSAGADGKIILLHEGSMPFNRGLKLMIEMFHDEYIRERFQLRIVGTLKGEEKEFFERKCREYNLSEENIYYTGWVDYLELPKALKGDIGIIFFEKKFNAFYSMPNKLFNYHAMGIPVISTHCAELSDTIEQLGTGVVVERSVESVREGLKELADNYEKYQVRVLKFQNMFHWSTDEVRLLEIYKNLLK